MSSIMNIFSGLSTLVITAATSVASVFMPATIHQAITTTQASMTPQVIASSKPADLITASGAYSYLNQNINYSISFPKSGGDVTGSVQGLCNGPISGKYQGGDGGDITGNATLTCHIALITQQINGTFKGKVYQSQHKIDLTVEGKNPTGVNQANLTINF